MSNFSTSYDMSVKFGQTYPSRLDEHTGPNGEKGWYTHPSHSKQKPDEEENPETIDFSFTCMTAELNLNPINHKVVEQLEEQNEPHRHYTQHFIEFNGNEKSLILKAIEENTILLKYATWILTNKEKIQNKEYYFKNEQLEDYVGSRLENIHNILMPFFIEGLIKSDIYGKYIGDNNKLLDHLYNEIDNEDNLLHRIDLLKTCNETIKCILNELKSKY